MSGKPNDKHFVGHEEHIELSHQLEIAPAVAMSNEYGAADDYKGDNADKGIAPLKTHLDTLGVWQALKVYKRISAVCMIASCSAMLDGYQQHFNGSIVSNKGFIRQFSGGRTKLKPSWVSAWGGTQSAGTVVAPMLIPFITDRFGRKVTLWITLVILTTSTFCESFVTNDIGWLFAKLLSGVGVSSMQATLPMYLAEMSPTPLRGFFTQSYTLSYVIGQLISSVPLNWYSKHDPYNFRTPIRIQFFLTGLLALAYSVMPETPWYRMQKGQIDAARAHYTKYMAHAPGFDVEEQLAVMQNTLEQERLLRGPATSVFNLDLFRNGNGKRYVISAWPKLLQQACGLNLFNTYATYFFQIAGFANPFLITIIQGCVQIIAMILTMGLVDTWGRRPLTVYGYLATVLSIFALGATGFYNIKKNKAASGLLVFFACLCNFSTTSASAVGYAYLTEIPRQDLRAKNAAWGLVFNAPIGLTLSYTTPLMINKWVEKTGLFYGIFGGMCWIVGFFIIPETARRSPAEIDELFTKNIPPRKFKGYVTDVQRELAAREQAQGLEVREPVNNA